MSRPAALAEPAVTRTGQTQRGLKVLVIGLALACLLATGYVLSPPTAKPPAAPSPAYLQAKGNAFFAASFKRLASGVQPVQPVQPLQPLRGQPVIAYFWASGCAACADEVRALQAMQDQYRARGLVVVGFGVDQADQIERFVRDNAINFTVFTGGQAAIDLSNKLGNLRHGMPFVVALDRQGRAALHHLGRFAPQTAQDMVAAALQ